LATSPEEVTANERAIHKDNPRDCETDPERWAKHRSRYIQRTTDFDSTDADVISWAELGYSHSGIAKKIDISRSAIKVADGEN
jgi:hypothetical protein